MSGIVQRLRDSVTQCRALDRSQLLEEAAAFIESQRLLIEVQATHNQVLWERLRAVTEPMPKEKRAEVSFTLTDAERAAIEAILVDADSAPANSAATLRGLLERFP